MDREQALVEIEIQIADLLYRHDHTSDDDERLRCEVDVALLEDEYEKVSDAP